MNTPRFNLLPVIDRRNARRFIVLRSARFSLCILIVLIAFSSIALMGGQRIFAETLADQKEKTAAAERAALGTRTSTLQQEIQSVNTLLGPVKTLQNEYRKWSGILSTITNRIPNGIALLRFEISRKPHTMTLAGTAATRNDLLSLQSALEEIPEVSDIVIPTTDLLQRENIAFRITAVLQFP